MTAWDLWTFLVSPEVSIGVWTPLVFILLAFTAHRWWR